MGSVVVAPVMTANSGINIVGLRALPFVEGAVSAICGWLACLLQPDAPVSMIRWPHR